jgi:hypothetical protein
MFGSGMLNLVIEACLVLFEAEGLYTLRSGRECIGKKLSAGNCSWKFVGCQFCCSKCRPFERRWTD